MLKSNPIFVALDTPSLDTATALAAHVAPHVGGVKLGLEFVSANGPEGVRTMVKIGLPVFLDVKLHDIPNTVAGAMKALAPLGAAIINVHASGGAAMMRAAVEAAASVHPKPKLLAVTVLTSLDAADLSAMGVIGSPLADERIWHRRRRLQPAGDRRRASGVRARFPDRYSGRSSCRWFARRSAPGDDAQTSAPRGRRHPGGRPADHRRCRSRRGRKIHPRRIARHALKTLVGIT